MMQARKGGLMINITDENVGDYFLTNSGEVLKCTGSKWMDGGKKFIMLLGDEILYNYLVDGTPYFRGEVHSLTSIVTKEENPEYFL